MKSALRRVATCVALAAAGAVTGGVVTTAIMPYLRQADPFGLSPIVVISILGGGVLGWYLRSRDEPLSVRRS